MDMETESRRGHVSRGTHSLAFIVRRSRSSRGAAPTASSSAASPSAPHPPRSSAVRPAHTGGSGSCSKVPRARLRSRSREGALLPLLSELSTCSSISVSKPSSRSELRPGKSRSAAAACGASALVRTSEARSKLLSRMSSYVSHSASIRRRLAWCTSRSVERAVAGRVQLQVVRSRASVPALAISSEISSLANTSWEGFGVCVISVIIVYRGRRRCPSKFKHDFFCQERVNS